MGDAKARRVLQVACDALGSALVVSPSPIPSPPSDKSEDDGPPAGGVDLDAAIAISGCICALAESSATAESLAGTTSTSTLTSVLTPAASGATRDIQGNLEMFPSAAGIVPNPKLGAPGSREAIIPHVRRGRSDEGGVAVASTAMQLLRTAERVLRPLGDSRALAMVLRGIAREWVREWATVVLKGGNGQARARAVAANARHPGTPADACTITGSSVAHREQLLLENTSRCLAEARSCLETLVSSAEPPGELLPSSTFALKRTKKIKDGPQTADGEGEGRDGAKSGSGKAKLSAKAQDKGPKGKSSTSGGKSAESIEQIDSTRETEETDVSPQGAISTPIGRELVMVQLEEAGVRAMLGRTRGETYSEKKAAEAAANTQGVNPVDRYMEESRPILHPTPEDMELPQAEQSLSLAGASKERIILSTDTVDLYPLALAWEGAALAALANRAGLSDAAWSYRPLPPPPPPPPPQMDNPAGKGSKGGAKGGGGKGGKGAKGGSVPAVSAEEIAEVRVPVFPLEENFDIRAQARWKLERSIDEATKAKRWDALGVAAFALGELIGGDDTVTAAGALMLHQSCRARRMLLHLVHESLPMSDRCRLSLDRITAAQGNLAGMHALDVYDSSLTSSPPVSYVADAWDGGDGRVANLQEFPPTVSAIQHLRDYLEGWRRLECAEAPGRLLAGLPQGLGVLSLQISPSGAALYAAAYAATPSTPPAAVDGAPTGVAPAAAVWRHEMKPSETRMFAALESRMVAFEVSVGRYCLEHGDEEGAAIDYCSPQVVSASTSSTTSLPTDNKEEGLGSSASESRATGSVKSPPSVVTAECESELDAICQDMEAILAPLWAADIEGGMSPFLERCRTERTSLVLLLNERLAKLPVESCAVFDGLPAISRDLSLHILRHRYVVLKAAELTGGEVSNARMRYVVDPLAEDAGTRKPPSRTSAPDPPPPAPTPVKKSKKGTASATKRNLHTNANCSSEASPDEGGRGRESTIQTLRQSFDCQAVGGGKSGGASGGRVKVSAWKGVAGDDHVAGVREWQALIGGESPGEPGSSENCGGGFLYYGPGRCLSKLRPRHLAGLSVNCQAAILIDRANNDTSHRRESKQDTVKSKEQIELERPVQVAALFSLVGCQSVVLNMWPTTFYNNRRIFCSLFRGWGDEGLTLGEAVDKTRGDPELKPRARWCTVLYGLPTLKFGA
ncbi:unnamed protein product [Sphacelaria rigidula]